MKPQVYYPDLCRPPLCLSLTEAVVLSVAISESASVEDPEGWFQTPRGGWENATGATRQALSTARKNLVARELLDQQQRSAGTVYWRADLRRVLEAISSGRQACAAKPATVHEEPKPKVDRSLVLAMVRLWRERIGIIEYGRMGKVAKALAPEYTQDEIIAGLRRYMEAAKPTTASPEGFLRSCRVYCDPPPELAPPAPTSDQDFFRQLGITSHDQHT